LHQTDPQDEVRKKIKYSHQITVFAFENSSHVSRYITEGLLPKF